MFSKTPPTDGDQKLSTKNQSVQVMGNEIYPLIRLFFYPKSFSVAVLECSELLQSKDPISFFETTVSANIGYFYWNVILCYV